MRGGECYRQVTEERGGKETQGKRNCRAREGYSGGNWRGERKHELGGSKQDDNKVFLVALPILANKRKGVASSSATSH